MVALVTADSDLEDAAAGSGLEDVIISNGQDAAIASG